MKRNIIKQLRNWKNSPIRMPLVLQGARQIGKSFIVNQFGESEYENFLYFNFEKEKSLASLFTDLTSSVLVQKLSYTKKQQIIPEKTLIIFDEVQACPQALTSLKYFCEEANQYHIIATGSLLGVSVNRGENSFPVGKVQFMNMYPMDFEEFLLANGEDFLISRIRECYENFTPMEEIFHEKALELYKQYLFTGGMPKIVDEFTKNQNQQILKMLKSDILESYQNDMGKYNKQSEISKTKLVYNNISTQLAKENRKFQYKRIKSGGRASEFESAIEWICLAGIATRVPRLEQIKLPLEANKSDSDFKFYMSDTGLCCEMQSLFMEDILYENSLLSEFMGGLTENYVCEQLRSKGLELYYWTSGNQAEVDFVTRLGEDIIPIEVKSSIHTRSKSLSVYKSKFNPPYAIRVSAKNFGYENGIKSLPLYAVFCL